MLSTPAIMYQAWRFIAPGLYRHEKKFTRKLFFWGLALFSCGGAFGYLVMMPVTLSFTMGYAGQGLIAMPRLELYLIFVLKSILVFGLIFELPFVMALAVESGIISSDTLRRKRKIAYLVLYLASVILIPTDIFSQILLLGPLIIVYETGLRFASWLS